VAFALCVLPLLILRNKLLQGELTHPPSWINVQNNPMCIPWRRFRTFGSTINNLVCPPPKSSQFKPVVTSDCLAWGVGFRLVCHLRCRLGSEVW
jgi:hypothetical protein